MRFLVGPSSSSRAFLEVSSSVSAAVLVLRPKAPMLPLALATGGSARVSLWFVAEDPEEDLLLAVTVFPAGLAISSGRAAAEASSLKVDFSGCFCLSFSVALFCRTALVLAVSSLASATGAGGGVAAAEGVAGAVTAGEAPEPGVSVFSLPRRSALSFFHSASFAARSASLSLTCVSGSFFLSSREEGSSRSRLSSRLSSRL